MNNGAVKLAQEFINNWLSLTSSLWQGQAHFLVYGASAIFFFFFGGGDIGRLDSRGFRILLSTDSVVESRGFASVNDDRELRPFWLMDRLRCAATLRPNYSAAHAGETTIERAGDRSAEAKATDTAKVNNCTSTATGQVQEEEDFVIEDYDDWSQPLSAPSVYLFTYFLPPPLSLSTERTDDLVWYDSSTVTDNRSPDPHRLSTKRVLSHSLSDQVAQQKLEKYMKKTFPYLFVLQNHSLVNGKPHSVIGFLTISS